MKVMSRKQKWMSSFFLTMIFIFSITACGTKNSESDLQINIIPAQAAIRPGGQQAFSASVMDAQGNAVMDVVPQWSSSNPATATISETGLATGYQEGTVQVTVSGGEESATATLEVTAAASRPVEVVGVFPWEDAIVSLSGCVPPPCRGFPMLPFSAEFNFPGDDTFESAILSLDGTELTSSVETVTDPIRLNAGVEGGIFYYQTLTLGTHQATVEAKSHAGQTVTYPWSFTITE